MRRFQQLFLIGVVFAANGLVAACSGDSNPTTDAGQDAGKDVVGKDVVSKDVVTEAGPVITPAGKQILSSDQVQIFGITTDDKVIYSDIGGGFTLYAADANGTGTPSVIATPTVSGSATFIVGIAGKVVFLWEGIATTANAPQVGKLSTWTSTGGFKAGITAKSCASTGFAASADGTKIMFAANSNTTCTTGDIVGANADGTSPSTLQTAVDIAATNCAPQLGFAGGVGPVTSHCLTDPGDGGTQVATVTSYTAAWAPTVIISTAESFWASDTAGDKLMVSSATTGIEVFPFGGGSATPIDAAHTITSGTFGYMFKDGNTVLYSTTGGDLYYAAVSNTPAPTKIVTADAKFFRSISSDDKYMMYSKAFETKQFASDIYLRTTNTTAASTTLVPTTTGALFGLNFTDDFTTDAKYALYIANADTTAFIGDLMVVPVGGTAGTKIASAEWLNLSALGSKIVFNDNCQGCGTKNNQVIGTADIKAVDVSTTATPTMLQAGADPQIYVPPTSKSHVVYTFSQNAPGGNDDGGPLPNGNGLWTVAIP